MEKSKNKIIAGKQIYVGSLGEAIISKRYGFIDAHFIKEEDGTKSWQVHPDEMRGDEVLKSVKVFPIDQDIVEQITNHPITFGLQLEKRRDCKIVELLKKTTWQKDVKE